MLAYLYILCSLEREEIFPFNQNETQFLSEYIPTITPTFVVSVLSLRALLLGSTYRYLSARLS